MRFYTVSEISENRHLTPEGFLLALNVPIARTGIQLYGANEVPIDADGNGIIKIARDEAEVFRAETIASFIGKPVTIDHPSDLVTPENWKELAVGTIQEVRRGSGVDNDLLYADIIITDRAAIDEIEAGKIEVSCGYDAEYEQTAIGRGRQFNIIGNHLALVDKGRCGSRCAIGDKQRSSIMAKQTMKDRIADKFRNAFKTRDEKILDEAIGDFEAVVENGGNESSNNVNANTVGGGQQQQPTSGERLRIIEDWMKAEDSRKAADKAAKDKEMADKKAKDEAEEEEKKKKESTEDNEYEKGENEKEEEHEKRTGDTLKNIQVLAEILSPGYKVPTLDCKCKDKRVRDQITDIKRKVLEKSYSTEDGKKAITPFTAGKTIDKLSHAIVDAAFIGASEIMRISNNKKSTSNNGSHATNDNNQNTIDAFSRGGIDAINQRFWTKK